MTPPPSPLLTSDYCLLSSPPRPRAFATLTALTLLAFLGTLSLLLSAHLRSQAARTRRDADQAQLRQLLHAGHLLASDLPTLWSTTPPQSQTLTLPLPEDLPNASITLTITPSPQSATVLLTATLNKTTTTETLHYTQSNHTWHFTTLTPN